MRELFKIARSCRLIMAMVLILAGLTASDAKPSSHNLTVGSLYTKCRLLLRQPAKIDPRKVTKQQVADMSICSAFITGFSFGKLVANEMNDTLGPYCLPKGYERGGRLIKTFVRWAARNPRMKKRPAAIGVLKALREHYACDERDRVK